MQQQLSRSTDYHQLLRIAMQLFRRPSPSGLEDRVRDYVIEVLSPLGFSLTVDHRGNVLATRGTPATGEGYPLLSFHMDIVTASAKNDSFTVPGYTQGSRKQAKKPISRDGQTLLPTGWAAPQVLPQSAIHVKQGRIHTNEQRVLGGDDKCGGAIALAVAGQWQGPLKLVASVREEIGCVGIEAVDPRFFADVSYALVLDRRGANDLITSIYGMHLCDEAFAQAMIEAAQSVGHVVSHTEGMLSDARTLARYIPNVVNMSVGYYEPHSVREYVRITDLVQSFRWTCAALESLPRPFPSEVVRNELEMEVVLETEDNALLCPNCRLLLCTSRELTEDSMPYVCLCNEDLYCPNCEQLRFAPENLTEALLPSACICDKSMFCPTCGKLAMAAEEMPSKFVCDCPGPSDDQLVPITSDATLTHRRDQ